MENNFLYYLGTEDENGVFTICGYNSLDECIENLEMSDINGVAWFLTNDSSLFDRGTNERTSKETLQ